ncbi:sensor domain-containing diguanylate cyclase [Providencia stuartii]|uniref:sensor domain-containing diguanylate cyclase n=1 Tax=Providencia TaxID=586 RepID=UPI000DE78C06|nr:MULTISPECIES: sensor domain-containing diguanylate cyclase [Providencia]SST04995.1 diguanylate cyclase/phosphodiesterase [Acinetobacter baumannii]
MINKTKELSIKNEKISLDLIIGQTCLFLLIDIYGRVSYVSQRFLETYNYNRADVIGYKPSIINNQLVLEKNSLDYISNYSNTEDIIFITKENKKIFFIARLMEIEENSNNVYHYCLILSEVTRLIAAKNKLSFQVYHDPLTGLLNRYGFYRKGKEALKLAKNSKTECYLALIDIDKFKKINDTFGHDYGDRLLKQFTKNVKKHLPSEVIFARLGGDEFVLMVNDIHHHHAESIFWELVHFMGTYSYCHLEGEVSNINISVGIAQYPRDGERLGSLVKNADIALYHAKKQGGNQIKKCI